MSSYLSYRPEWIREDFVDFIAEKINPIWAWKRIKATVVKTDLLSTDFIKIQLRPNRNFPHQAMKAGQSILLTLVIAGIRQQRSYSIVEVLDNGDLILGIKAQGKVSHLLHNLEQGAVVEISAPQGDFVLDATDTLILLIASGSGITAIYALLNQALATDSNSIDLIYFTRDDAFHVELMALAQRHPQFHYHHINTLAQKQHFDLVLLNQLCPHYKNATTYACGAAAMMQSLNQIYQQQDLTTQLKQEYFQLNVDENLPSQPISFQRSQVEFTADTNLLVSAEQAGLKPTHGCRMGICNTCTCTKVSGSTKNVLTGEIDHGSNTQIKLCISQAVSPVVINL